jgi:hypothetical protein
MHFSPISASWDYRARRPRPPPGLDLQCRRFWPRFEGITSRSPRLQCRQVDTGVDFGAPEDPYFRVLTLNVSQFLFGLARVAHRVHASTWVFNGKRRGVRNDRSLLRALIPFTRICGRSVRRSIDLCRGNARYCHNRRISDPQFGAGSYFAAGWILFGCRVQNRACTRTRQESGESKAPIASRSLTEASSPAAFHQPRSFVSA